MKSRSIVDIRKFLLCFGEGDDTNVFNMQEKHVTIIMLRRAKADVLQNGRCYIKIRRNNLSVIYILSIRPVARCAGTVRMTPLAIWMRHEKWPPNWNHFVTAENHDRRLFEMHKS